MSKRYGYVVKLPDDKPDWDEIKKMAEEIDLNKVGATIGDALRAEQESRQTPMTKG